MFGVKQICMLSRRQVFHITRLWLIYIAGHISHEDIGSLACFMGKCSCFVRRRPNIGRYTVWSLALYPVLSCSIVARTHLHGIKLQYHSSWFGFRDFTMPQAERNPWAQTRNCDIVVSFLSHGFLLFYPRNDSGEIRHMLNKTHKFQWFHSIKNDVLLI